MINLIIYLLNLFILLTSSWSVMILVGIISQQVDSIPPIGYATSVCIFGIVWIFYYSISMLQLINPLKER
jgi:hypothetical protein